MFDASCFTTNDGFKNPPALPDTGVVGMDGVRIVQVWGKRIGRSGGKKHAGVPKEEQNASRKHVFMYMLIYNAVLPHVGLIFTRNCVQTFCNRRSAGKPQWMVLTKNASEFWQNAWELWV